MASVKGDGRGGRGRFGEQAAIALLEQKGYAIVDTNVRLGQRKSGVIGEIDIVAWDGETLCFVEVKTRRGNPRGVSPGESITLAKQRQIANLALAYANGCGLFGDDADIALRFDVVLVVLAGSAKSASAEEHVLRADLWRGAFLAPSDL